MPPKGKTHTLEARLKMSLVHKGHKATRGMLGKRHSAATRAKMSAARSGKPMHSEEFRQRLAARNVGNKYGLGRVKSESERARIGAATRRRWADPAYHKRTMSKVIAAGRASPNKAELHLLVLLNEAEPGAWRYVGDGSLVIGGKNPDFANVNGKKKLVELFGNFYHRSGDVEPRIENFARFGYQTLIVWERELSEPTLLDRLRQFANS